MSSSQFTKYLIEERGNTAAEFGFVLVVFISLVLIVIGMSLMLVTNAALQYAVEQAARCQAVGICTGGTNTQTYATSHYYGPLSPTFTATSSGCGNTVTGTATLPLDVGLIDLSIPINAAACYPTTT